MRIFELLFFLLGLATGCGVAFAWMRMQLLDRLHQWTEPSLLQIRKWYQEDTKFGAVRLQFEASPSTSLPLHLERQRLDADLQKQEALQVGVFPREETSGRSMLQKCVEYPILGVALVGGLGGLLWIPLFVARELVKNRAYKGLLLFEPLVFGFACSLLLIAVGLLRLSWRGRMPLRRPGQHSTGDPRFDEAFCLSGEEDHLLACLDHPTRRLLLDDLPHLAPVFQPSQKLSYFPQGDRREGFLQQQLGQRALASLRHVLQRLQLPKEEIPERLLHNVLHDPEGGVQRRSLRWLQAKYSEHPATQRALEFARHSDRAELRSLAELLLAGRDDFAGQMSLAAPDAKAGQLALPQASEGQLALPQATEGQLTLPKKQR